MASDLTSAEANSRPTTFGGTVPKGGNKAGLTSGLTSVNSFNTEARENRTESTTFG